MVISSVAMPACCNAVAWNAPRPSTPALPCRISTAGTLAVEPAGRPKRPRTSFTLQLEKVAPGMVTGSPGASGCAAARLDSASAATAARATAVFPDGMDSVLFLGRMRMGPAYGRRNDLVRDVKVPHRGAAARG